MAYTWKKVWAIQTNNEDEVKVDDVVEVTGGTDSKQKVVSVTTMKNRQGKPYKVLLTEEVK